MITFRAFSRFVRWYRWEILLAAATSLAAWLFLQPRITAILAAFLGWNLVGLLSVRSSLFRTKVRERAARVAEGRAARRAAAIRSLPLRGWTR